jgi:hypothetical protein
MFLFYVDNQYYYIFAQTLIFFLETSILFYFLETLILYCICFAQLQYFF